MYRNLLYLLFLFESQVVGASIASADVNQFDPCGSLSYDLPIFTKTFKIIAKIELDIKTKIMRVVIIDVAVSYIPCTRIGDVAIRCSKNIITSKGEHKAAKMTCFIFAGINKRSNPPAACLYIVFDNGLWRNDRIAIWTGGQVKNNR